VAKCKEITGPCRKFLSERSFVAFTPGQYTSDDQMRMRWTGHVTCFLGKRRNGAHWVLWGNLNGRDHLEDLDVYRSIILK
jgi:hypothetical protein